MASSGQHRTINASRGRVRIRWWELRLNRAEVGKYVSVIELEIIDDQSTR